MVLKKLKKQKYQITISKLTHAQRHEKIINIDERMCKAACSTTNVPRNYCSHVGQEGPCLRILDGVAEANVAKAEVALSIIALRKCQEANKPKPRTAKSINPAWLGGLLVDNQLEEASESNDLRPALFGHHGERLVLGGNNWAPRSTRFKPLKWIQMKHENCETSEINIDWKILKIYHWNRTYWNPMRIFGNHWKSRGIIFAAAPSGRLARR